MIVYPVRRSVAPFLWFVVALLSLYLATVGLFWIFVAPTQTDLQIMAAVLGSATAVVGWGGFLAYRKHWIYRVLRVGTVVWAAYLLAAALILVIVWFVAQLLFINPYDVVLVAIVMLFASGVVVSIGYIQSAALSEKLESLSGAAELLAMGRYHVRVEIDDNDELSRLASIFNVMASQLEAAARKEHQLDLLRRDLMVWIGYDLRVPLMSTRTMVESITEGLVSDPEIIDRYLQIAKRDINVLSDLVDDLYDMAQLDTNGIRLERAPTRICDLIDLTMADLAQEALQKKVSLTSRCAADVPVVAMDMRQMARAMNNLARDAIHRVPKGGSVRINAYPTRSGVLIEIADFYEGTRPEDIATTLKLFFGEDDVRSQTNETTRLRLALANAIVRAHGSTIRLQRIGDQGLRLVFALTEDGDRPLTVSRGM